MRFMMIVKATQDSEAGVMPKQEMLEEMTRYNEELDRAGVLLAGEGLHPSSRGFRVRFEGGEKRLVDGPFTETKELIAGFWLIQVRSEEEAREWARRIPHPHPGIDTNVEVRRIFEAEDFGEEFTPELREREQRMRDNAEARGG